MKPRFVNAIHEASAAGDETGFGPLAIVGEDALPSSFAVTDLAVASLGAAGQAVARYAAADGPPRPVQVDRRRASFWFGETVRPIGWSLPPLWDPIAGNYRAQDGWIRLHTNAPAHRDAALRALGLDQADRETVAAAVARWPATALEEAVVKAGGAAAEMRDLEAWATHPQGRAVAAEPLIRWEPLGAAAPIADPVDPRRPLGPIRVLDLTRVLAGPTATRFLACFGAQVLRIDPPGWNEPAAELETTLGKRCAGLDLRDSKDRAIFEGLLSQADLLAHGYRKGALDGLGYDAARLRALNPGLIDVALNAYGWTGPWSGRRGFDSLVQMSAGVADFGMRRASADRPVPLPVQALDFATGYLFAAAALQALTERRRGRPILRKAVAGANGRPADRGAACASDLRSAGAARRGLRA